MEKERPNTALLHPPSCDADINTLFSAAFFFVLFFAFISFTFTIAVGGLTAKSHDQTCSVPHPLSRKESNNIQAASVEVLQHNKPHKHQAIKG